MLILQILFYSVVGIVLLGAVFVYGIVPLMIRAQTTESADFDLVPTTADELNETARQGIAHAVVDLIPLGFVVVANVKRSKPSPGAVVVQVLLVNREGGDSAHGFFVARRTGEAYNESWTLAITTELADGSRLRTHTSRSPTIFPRDPKLDAVNPHWIASGRALYSIHRARVERWARAVDHPRLLPQPGDEVEYLKRDSRREYDRVVAAGYFWLDEAGGVYRKTLKGAYLMTWRMLWPLKGMRSRARERKARRVLRELGFVE